MEQESEWILKATFGPSMLSNQSNLIMRALCDISAHYTPLQKKPWPLNGANHPLKFHTSTHTKLNLCFHQKWITGLMQHHIQLCTSIWSQIMHFISSGYS